MIIAIVAISINAMVAILYGIENNWGWCVAFSCFTSFISGVELGRYVYGKR